MFRTVSMIIVFVVLLVTSQIFEFVQRQRGIGTSSKKVDDIECVRMRARIETN